MPSRGNNGYIGGINNRSTADAAKAVFNSRDLAYCVESGDVADAAEYEPVVPSYTRPSSGGGSGATATVSLKNGSVGYIRVTAVGSGYTSDPTVTFTGGGGSGAEAYVTRTSNTITAVNLWFQVYDVEIIYGGEGYTSDPTVAISAPSAGGTAATVTGVTRTNGVITAITFGVTGTRYTGQPTITLTTAGSTRPAILVAKLRCGSGYTSAPAIGFSGGNGANAAATAYIDAELDTVTITANGSGYTTAPTVFIPGMNSSASASATISGGQVTGITISGCTNRFSDPPTVIIGGWPSLPAITGSDQKFVGAYAIFNHSSNFVAVQCQGAYTVDWGDGTSNNYTSNTIAYKQYTATEYAALSTQSAFKGYKVVMITITPQAGNNLTKVDLQVNHNQSGLNNFQKFWLDVKVAGSNLTYLRLSGHTLEQFEFLGANTVLTDWTSMFSSCRSLVNIIALPPSTPTNLTQSFLNCASLTYIPNFTTSGITTLNNAFTNCYSLARIPAITSTTITDFASTFSGCYSLTYAPVRITSSATNLAGTFTTCRKLSKLPPMDVSNVTNSNTAFSGCVSIVSVPDLDLRKSTSTNAMFGNCFRLRSVGYLNTAASTDMSSMFLNCSDLRKIDYLDTGKTTTLFGAFQGCRSLESLPVINLASCTSLQSAFRDCNSLKSISFINSQLLTDLSNTFYDCNSLIEAPYISSHKVTTFQNAFINCYSMQTIPQYSYQANVSFASTFGNTVSLNTIPKINAPRATDISFILSGSNVSYLESITLSTGAISASSAFTGSYMANFPTLDFSGVTASPGNFATTSAFRSGYTTGMKYGHSYQNCAFAAAELDTIYTNLGTAVGAQTINVTGNWGTASDTTSIATNKGWTVSG